MGAQAIAITVRSYQFKDPATIASKKDENKKIKAKPNESSTAEPAGCSELNGLLSGSGRFTWLLTLLENARFSPRIGHTGHWHHHMHIEENSKINWLLSSVPLLLGCLGCLLCGTYQAQRCGFFLDSFYAFDRFIQHHLDAFAGWAILASLLGIVLGLVIHRIWRRSRLVKYGIIFSVAALVWATLGLSL